MGESLFHTPWSEEWPCGWSLDLDLRVPLDLEGLRVLIDLEGLSAPLALDRFPLGLPDPRGLEGLCVLLDFKGLRDGLDLEWDRFLLDSEFCDFLDLEELLLDLVEPFVFRSSTEPK